MLTQLSTIASTPEPLPWLRDAEGYRSGEHRICYRDGGWWALVCGPGPRTRLFGLLPSLESAQTAVSLALAADKAAAAARTLPDAIAA